jgi:DNA polymerase-1
VRDEEGKRVTRGGIIPSKGNHILESDYKAIEVRIMACYTKDPVLERYIKDPKTDMHRDQAEALFILKTNQITKDLRFYTKNNFVFPEFYGSYFVACGRDLWDNCSGLKLEDGTTIAKHLKAQGIKNQQDFIEHVKSVETKFWDKLHVSRLWREKVLAEYQKKGYIETFLGFRRKGYLKNNQVFNSPIQGTAFHCLLWSFSRVGEYLRKNGLKTKLIGQIHDSMITDLHIPETALVKDIIDEFGCNAIREKFDWITVPLEIEHTVYTTSWFGKDELDEE